MNNANVFPSAASIGLVEIVHRAQVTSTMDEAHALAADGAPAGTAVIADEQIVGRGRAGRKWHSATGDGLWFTLIERPVDASALDVLSLRLGLALAEALDRFTDEAVRLKWPNDLYLRNAKLAGILVEARWRMGALDWIAIGVGINLRANEHFPDVASLRDDATRGDVLAAIARPMRTACAQTGLLSETERLVWFDRDFTIGRRVTEPLAGTVAGLAGDGALLINTLAGETVPLRAGSLVFATPHQESTTC